MTSPRPGRPRSEASRRSILDATSRLIVEHGYENLTLGEVATSAGVGKQTLYRWWPSKAALVADCVLEDSLAFTPVTVSASGDALAAIHSWLSDSYSRMSQPGQAELFRGLTAAASSDESVRARLDERFSGPLIDGIDAALQSGIAAGDIRADVTTGALARVLLGAMVFTLLQHRTEDASWVDELMTTVSVGIRTNEGRE